eukprot:385601-Pleurochrysis_carterae.AAC.1
MPRQRFHRRTHRLRVFACLLLRSATVFVPRRLWPAYACHEHIGRGWTGRVLSLTKRSVLVASPFTADDAGRRYAP